MGNIERIPILFDLDQTLVDSSIADGMRASRRWREVYSKIPEFRLYHGISGALEALGARGLPLAIVTSSPRTYAEKVINRFKFQVDELVAYHDTPRRKPHPDPLLLAAARLGVQPDSCIYVGDAEIDARAANAAGMRSATALWGRPDGSRLPDNLKSTYLNHPTELLDLIDPPDGTGQICPGSPVRHQLFGAGIVASLKKQGTVHAIVVDFDRVGKKTLILEYAKLDRIEE